VYGPARVNWSDTGKAAGSAYVDIAIIDLDTTVEWWMAADGPGFASCGAKRAIQYVAASGYPGQPLGHPYWPHTAAGSIEPVDFCDGVTDTAKSSDVYTVHGMSGGPVYLTAFDGAAVGGHGTRPQIAVLSGCLWDPKNESCHYKSVFAPLDSFNMGLINGRDSTGTLWSRSSECLLYSIGYISTCRMQRGRWLDRAQPGPLMCR
jgi:hypothetical protein